MTARLARFGALALLFVVACLPAAGRQAATLALVGARVLPVSGPPIERGTVLVAGGKITAVGRSVGLPAGAQPIDLRGRVLIPGLVDARSSLFVPESEQGGAGAADRDVLDAADFFTRDVEPVLAHGVTTLYLAPPGRGSIIGTGAVVKLAAPVKPGDGAPPARVLKPRAALELSLGVSTNNRSSSLERLAGYESLRSAFRGAQQYRQSLDRYERDLRAYEAAPGQPPPSAGTPPNAQRPTPNAQRPSRPRRSPADEVLVAALKGELPVRIEAHRVEDLLNALRLADEFRLKLVLEGATEGTRLAPELAKRQLPLIWGPALLAAPPRLETRRQTPESAAAFARAGVRLALVTGAESGLASRFLLENAAAAAGYGLPRHQALRAVTLGAAENLGIDAQVGSLSPGKDADLVVLTGDPFAPTTHVEQVFIDGRLVYPKQK